jgi:hypothetical protein
MILLGSGRLDFGFSFFPNLLQPRKANILHFLSLFTNLLFNDTEPPFKIGIRAF